MFDRFPGGPQFLVSERQTSNRILRGHRSSSGQAYIQLGDSANIGQTDATRGSCLFALGTLKGRLFGRTRVQETKSDRDTKRTGPEDESHFRYLLAFRRSSTGYLCSSFGRNAAAMDRRS